MEQQQDKYISTLDVGTSKVITLVSGIRKDNEIHIVDLDRSPSRGLRAGIVTNIDTTVQAIRQAVEDAELMADTKISHVVTGIVGSHIRSLNSQGVVKTKDDEVSQTDIDRAIGAAKTVNILPDHNVLHTVVRGYIIDNRPGMKEPIDMGDVRLDTRVHIIIGANTALQNIQKCIQRCDLQMDQVILQSLASGHAVLTGDKKGLGVCVIGIGGGTADIAAYTNDTIRHAAVIPVTGDLITKDLVQALRTPHGAAEYIKIHYGATIPTMDGLDEMIEVPSVGDHQSRQISHRVLAGIIDPRVEGISELTLDGSCRSGFPGGMLTSGIVLTGSASMLTGIVELVEGAFNLPVRIGIPQEVGGVSERIRNPRYSTVIGLLQTVYTAKEDEQTNRTGAITLNDSGKRMGPWEKIQRFFRDNFW